MDNQHEERDHLKSQLTEQSMVVTFEKADGTPRIMKCTTNPDVVPWPDNPVEDVSVTKTEKVKDENHFVVWDLEKEGWRSFKWERVTGWNKETENG
jgi:hypothetical protein